MSKYQCIYFKHDDLDNSLLGQVINANSLNDLPVKTEGLNHWPTGTRCKSLRIKLLLEYFLELNKLPDVPTGRIHPILEEDCSELADEVFIEPSPELESLGYQTTQRI